MGSSGETTMLTLLPAYNPNSSHIDHNDTIDVVRKGCFWDFNTVACIRNGVLALLGVLTALACFLRVMRFHLNRHQACHQYIIFYCAAIECIIGTVHWILGRYAQLDFIIQYLKLLQFLVMCHFYCTLASRILRKEALVLRFLVPILVAAFSYFTIIVTLGIINTESSWVECLASYWIELSTVEFVLVQIFMVAGFYINRRLNEISMLDSVRWQQKRDLWCIIIVFEFSAFSGLIFDLTMLVVGDRDTGCSGIFLHMQELYSAIFVTYMILKLFMPIWVMLCVFHPVPPAPEDLLPVISEDGTYTSLFSPTAEDQNYRQLYHPTEDYRSLEDNTSPVAPPTSTSGSRATVAHRTPSLTPIKEEGNSNPRCTPVATSTPQTPPPPSSLATTPEYRPPPKGTFYL